MRHVLSGQDHGNDTFVAVPSSHLVALHDFAGVGNPYAHHHRDARRQFVAIFFFADADFNDLAFFAVRNSQARVFGVARLSLRRLPAGVSLLRSTRFRPSGVTLPTSMSPGPTHVPGITMPSSSRFARLVSPTLAMSRVISSGPSCVSLSFDLMFLYVGGREAVFLYEVFAEDDRVFVVAATPTHETDEHVLTKGQTSSLG